MNSELILFAAETAFTLVIKLLGFSQFSHKNTKAQKLMLDQNS